MLCLFLLKHFNKGNLNPSPTSDGVIAFGDDVLVDGIDALEVAFVALVLLHYERGELAVQVVVYSNLVVNSQK